MLSHIEALKVAGIFQYIDEICREDLSLGLINSERDYVSHFISHINRPEGVFYPRQKFSTLYTLPSIVEQLFGADGIIIFKFKNNYKVSIFEAKFPKITKPQEVKWDYIYKSNNKYSHLYSHFTEQIVRQNDWSNTFAIWEMFQNENQNGTISKYNFLNNGSTCVWHQDVYNYISANRASLRRKRWLRNDLQSLLLHSSNNLLDIIYNILVCNQGRLLVSKNDELKVTSMKDIEVAIPIPQYTEDLKGILNEKKILTFMKVSGLTRYIFFDTQIYLQNYWATK